MRGSDLRLMPDPGSRGVELVPWMRARRRVLLLTGALVSFAAGCFSSSGNGGEPDAGIADSGNDGSPAECGDGGSGACVDGECDFPDHSDCADGLKCALAITVSASGTTTSGVCRPAGPQEAGERCGGDGPPRCAPGTECWVDRCLAYCKPERDAPDCVPFLDGVDVGFRRPTCELFEEGCPWGWTCRFVFDRIACEPVGSQQDGESCFSESCEAGLECVADGDPRLAVCRPLCDLSSPEACSGARVESCTSLKPFVPEERRAGVPDDLGVCAAAPE